MLGYWKNEAATKETIRDEWLFTGDLGYLDKENYLYVLGRFKSLLISFDGEKYSPEGIEEAIIDNCPLIEQFLLYNNQSPYTIGLIVPNTDKIKNLKKENKSIEENAKTILSEIVKELGEFKTGGKHQDMFPQRWLPATIIILPEPLTESNKMLNSSLKVVRRLVEKTYKNEIDFLFTTEGKDIMNNKNITNIINYL
jgi:long-chain acyl-CoA synthetase